MIHWESVGIANGAKRLTLTQIFVYCRYLQTFHITTSYNGVYAQTSEPHKVIVSPTAYFRKNCKSRDFDMQNVVIRVECHRKILCMDQDLSRRMPRVAGGYEVAAVSNPWMVALYKNGYQYCGGSIIGNKWVKFSFKIDHRNNFT